MNWLGSSLRAKLLVAHLVLVAICTGTFFVVARLLAPASPVGDHAVASIDRAIWVAAGAGGLAAVAAGVFISARVAGPLRRMVGATRHIAAGNYSERIRIEAIDPVSELSQLATSFNDMARSLETTEQRRSELLADAAHELRTPISTLEGYLEGLLDGVVESSPETWARLHDEAGRLRRLVDDLQELSRAEARQLSLKLEAVEPEAIARASVDGLRHDFEGRGLELAVSVAQRLPRVRADRDRAVQVVTNMLTNALRYTPQPGRVELAVRLCGGAETVAFEVRDTGVGIAAEQLPFVFERFYRVDKSRSRQAGGSGIGLTIARAIAEAMGGTIVAESGGVGLGSTFTFTLPVGVARGG